MDSKKFVIELGVFPMEGDPEDIYYEIVEALHMLPYTAGFNITEVPDASEG